MRSSSSRRRLAVSLESLEGRIALSGFGMAAHVQAMVQHQEVRAMHHHKPTGHHHTPPTHHHHTPPTHHHHTPPTHHHHKVK